MRLCSVLLIARPAFISQVISLSRELQGAHHTLGANGTAHRAFLNLEADLVIWSPCGEQQQLNVKLFHSQPSLSLAQGDKHDRFFLRHLQLGRHPDRDASLRPVALALCFTSLQLRRQPAQLPALPAHAKEFLLLRQRSSRAPHESSLQDPRRRCSFQGP